MWCFPFKANKQVVVLRRSQGSGGSRSLLASLDHDGNLTIDGHDIGPEVEQFWGCSEYEWRWNIHAADVPALKEALGGRGRILNLLKTRFSEDHAAELQSFLRQAGIEYTVWSRLGD